ncbi:MAG: hypothetical protein KY453_01710 [Gemmatimonadetes bacterium]|nr:hypothetical protein [Gemmatimonadota bacterium]
MDGRRSRRRALVALMALVPGCEEPAAPGAEAPQGEIGSVAGLADALRAEGATVEVSVETAPSLFSVPGRLLLVDGVQVEVFVFPDAATAAGEAPLLTRSLILWVAPARLFGMGPLLALHVGNEGRGTELLRRVLGPPLAVAGVS